jgi:hypothetical protein
LRTGSLVLICALLLAASETGYNAMTHEVVDVMLPGNAVALQSKWESSSQFFVISTTRSRRHALRS